MGSGRGGGKEGSPGDRRVSGAGDGETGSAFRGPNPASGGRGRADGAGIGGRGAGGGGASGRQVRAEEEEKEEEEGPPPLGRGLRGRGGGARGGRETSADRRALTRCAPASRIIGGPGASRGWWGLGETEASGGRGEGPRGAGGIR